VSVEQISANQVTKKLNVKYLWGGVYDYFGQVDPDTGKEHGFGRRCWHKKGIEEGQFKNGQPDGYCREIFTTGTYYEGMWVEGWRHGFGIEVSSNGTIKKGLWQNHTFVEEM
jgi:hypothetical protein